MVLKRNRKLPAKINRCLSTDERGVQTYETTLSNSLGYTDGWASSIWPMGSNISFHNTGSSVGGDFGELNKLNYDYLIHFYDGNRRPGTIAFVQMTDILTGSVSCQLTLKNSLGGCENILYNLEFEFDGPTCGSPQKITFFDRKCDGARWQGWNNAVWFVGQQGNPVSYPTPAMNVPTSASFYLGSTECPSLGGIDPNGCYQCVLGATVVGNEGAFEFKVSGNISPPRDTGATSCNIGCIDYQQNDRWAMRVGLQDSGSAYPYLGWSLWYDIPLTLNPCPTSSLEFYPDLWTGVHPVPDNRYNDHTMIFSIQLGMTQEGSNPSLNTYRPEGAIGGGFGSGWSYSAWVRGKNTLLVKPGGYGDLHRGHNIMRWSSAEGELNPDTDRFRIVRNWNPSLTSSLDGKLFDNISYQREILFQISRNNGCWHTFWKEDMNTLYLDDRYKYDDVPMMSTTTEAQYYLNTSYYAVVDFSGSALQCETQPKVDCEPNTRPCAIMSMSMTNYASNYAGSPPEWSASISYTYPAGFITNDSNPYYTNSAGIYKDYGLMWDVAKERKRLLGEARYPFFNSYEEYAQDIRSMAKDCTIMPEYKISDFVDNGVEERLANVIASPNRALFSLPGGAITSSLGEVSTPGGGQTLEVEHFNLDFFKEYSNSDFMADFDLFQQQYDDQDPQFARQAEITMSCRGVMKLLPYEGFYPMNRTTQLSTKFKTAMEPHLRLFEYDANSTQFQRIPDNIVNASPELTSVRTQGITMPFYAPGILYNSIKSGVGVGWTVVTSSCLSDTYYFQNVFSSSVSGAISGNYQTGDFLNTVVYNDPAVAEKIPFEALYDMTQLRHPGPSDNADSLNGAFHINYPETLQGYFPLDISSVSASGQCPPSIPFCAASCSFPPSGTLTPLNKLYMLAYDGVPDENMKGYSLAMNNFLASTVRFFLQPTPGHIQTNQSFGGGSLNRFQSSPVAEIAPRITEGVTYYMDVILESTNPDFTMCESAFPRRQNAAGEMGGTYNSRDGHFVARDPNSRRKPGAPSRPSWDYPAWDFNVPKEPEPSTIIQNHPSSFNGRYFGPATRKYANLFNWSSASEGAHYNVSDPAQAPYTPPYYYGTSVARIKYKAGSEWSSALHTNPLQAVFNNMTMSFFNSAIEDMIKESNLNFVASNEGVWAHPWGEDTFTSSSFAVEMAQNVGDSINLKGMSLRREETKNALGMVTDFKNIYNNQEATWVISPKFESPILNFSTQLSDTMTVEGGLHPTQSFSQSAGFLDGTPIGLGKGMWSGYGLDESTTNPSVRLRVAQSVDSNIPERVYFNGAYRSTNMAEAFGFDQDPDYGEGKILGKLADTAIISEAVVAIPFTPGMNHLQSSDPITLTGDQTDLLKTPRSNSARPYATTVDPTSPDFRNVYNLFNADRPAGDKINFFEINQALFHQLKTDPNIWTKPPFETAKTIKDLMRNMRKYVFPPELDFVHRDNILPFVMYVFPFEHSLSKTDLQDIWQGVLPKIGINAELESTTIQHSLENKFEFFHNRRLPADIRWLVFKVKQRAEMNYTNITSDMTDNGASQLFVREDQLPPPQRLGDLGEPLPGFGEPTSVFNTTLNEVFSYNWPHDFYSLLELGKVETDIKWTGTPPGEPLPSNPLVFDASSGQFLLGSLG